MGGKRVGWRRRRGREEAREGGEGKAVARDGVLKMRPEGARRIFGFPRRPFLKKKKKTSPEVLTHFKKDANAFWETALALAKG